MLDILSSKSKMLQGFCGFQQERGRDLTFDHKETQYPDLQLYSDTSFKVLSFGLKRSAGKNDFIMNSCLKEKNPSFWKNEYFRRQFLSQ